MWQDSLNLIAKDLSIISKKTETHVSSDSLFLRNLSLNYKENANKANSISQKMDSDPNYGVKNFQELLSIIYEEAESCIFILNESISSMNQLIPEINKILELEGFLGHLVQSTQMISPLMGIHVAKSKSNQFDSIKGLSHEIFDSQKKLTVSVELAFGAIKESKTEVNQWIIQFNGSFLERKKEVACILEEIDNNRNQTIKICNRIGSSSSKISPEIAGIVSSLQYNDICRQAMEHICETLQELANKQNVQNDFNNQIWCINVLEIQVAQLNNVLEERSTMESETLKHIQLSSGLAKKQLQEAEKILEQKDLNDERIQKIEVIMDALFELISQAKNRLEVMITIFSEINSHIEVVFDQISNVKLIEEDLKTVALNAILKSGYGGIVGKELRAISSAINELSSEAEDILKIKIKSTQTILHTLDDFRQNLSEKLRQQLQATTENTQMAQKSKNDLLLANNDLMNSMVEVTNNAQSLEKDISKFISNRNFQKRIQSNIQSVVAELQSILNKIKNTSRKGIPQVFHSEEFSSLMNRYSTEKERKIHKNCLIDAGILNKNEFEDENLTLTVSNSVSDEDFGENIELF